MDCSSPGSSVRGILQACILAWVAIPFSRGSSQPRDWAQVSHIAGRAFTIRDTRKTIVKSSQLHLFAPFHLTCSHSLLTVGTFPLPGTLWARCRLLLLLFLPQTNLDFCYHLPLPSLLFSCSSSCYSSSRGTHQWPGHIFPSDHVCLVGQTTHTKFHYSRVSEPSSVHDGKCLHSPPDCRFLHLPPVSITGSSSQCLCDQR